MTLLNCLIKFNNYFFIRDWISNFEKITKEKIHKNNFRNDNDYNYFLKIKTFSIFEFCFFSIFAVFTTNTLFFFLLLTKIIDIHLSKHIKETLTKKLVLLGSLLIRISLLSAAILQTL
jgi:hypothetical protein